MELIDLAEQPQRPDVPSEPNATEAVREIASWYVLPTGYDSEGAYIILNP